MDQFSISKKEFKGIRDLLYQKTGIYLPDAKIYLVVHRLMKRLTELDMYSFSEYSEYLLDNSDMEMQHLINSLTTNETFFFREGKHFEFLSEILKTELSSNARVRLWSAACSSGEEAYSAAMILCEILGYQNWEIIGSDISEVVLDKARKGAYPIDRSSQIPKQYLKKYCLKGVRSNTGQFTISNQLRNSIHFLKINLYDAVPDIGMFDIIFLRNILIYFDTDTKKAVIRNVLPLLKKRGFLIVSHTESLVGITNELDLEKHRPSIYRKR